MKSPRPADPLTSEIPVSFVRFSRAPINQGMGGHGGLNILPQKRWNVYNYENREKVRRDEEAAAREEQLKRDDARKRDTELRLEKLRQARGLASASVNQAAEPSSSKSISEETRLKNDSNHLNLFEGIRIFDPVEAKTESKDQRPIKKVKKEQPPRVVTAEDEKYKLGYGIVGKGTKLPWYLEKPSNVSDVKSDDDDDDDLRPAKKKSNGKKTVEELRKERLEREKREKQRERALLKEKSRRDGGFSLRR